MTTQLALANMALSHIGARDNIPSLAENSVEARTVSLWIDPSRRQTLEAYNWNFAKKRAALVADADDPPEGEWGWRFVYPADCLKAREIQNPGVPYIPHALMSHRVYAQPDAMPFEVELSPDGTRKTILTEMEEPVLIYTANITDLELFSALAVNALSYALAHNIAFKLTGKMQLADRMFQLFLNSIRMAAMHDGNEQVERAPREAEVIRGRM